MGRKRFLACSKVKMCGVGLGRKSVACIMLLCLRMQEFPVDVNVGRICSRLGWIPLDSELGIEVHFALGFTDCQNRPSCRELLRTVGILSPRGVL